MCWCLKMKMVMSCCSEGLCAFVVGVISLVAWFLLRRIEDFRMKKKRSSDEKMAIIPKGSKGWPLIGETLEFIASGYTSNPVSFMEKRKALYGDVFRTHILGKAIIVSTDPEVNKVILQNYGNVFMPCYPKSITELLGKSSILQTNGALHKRLHASIGVFLKSPHFKARITRDIENSVKDSLSTWMTKTPCVYLQAEVKKITFEILVRVLLSVGPGDDMNFLKREFEEFIKGLICIPIKFPGTRLYKSLQAKKRLLKLVSKIIEERKSSMENKEFPDDAIDVLLRDNTGESDELQQLPVDSISGNIIEMMIPGEETVPTAMTLAVKFLTDNPVALACLVFSVNGVVVGIEFVEKKLLESLRGVQHIIFSGEENMELQKRKERNCEQYSWTDYMSLEFTQNVISETLRLANIINAVWRKALKDVEIKGYLIPKGWGILASLSSVHMNETNYENPLEFDPWRWKNAGSAASSNLFTPFGGGQRLCPGLELSRLEISIFLHHFSTTYRWDAAEKDEIIYFPTVRMKRKMPITIMPLHSQ